MSWVDPQTVKSLKSLRSIGLILILLGLGGCGFHLAGKTSLPPDLVSIQLDSDGLDRRQQGMLERQLLQAGAKLGASGTASARLRVAIKALPERKLADTAGSGKTITRLFRELSYSLKRAGASQSSEQKTIRRQFDLEIDSNDLAGLEYEKTAAEEQLDQELINLLIFQLRHLAK